MNYSSMTLNELIRAAQDSDCDLVKALVSVLDEVAADKTEPEDKEYRSPFDEQLEYVKKILDLPNEY